MKTAPTANSPKSLSSKAPEIALSFWIIKIMSTTVGETGADFLAFHTGLGPDLTMAFMATLLALALFLQLRTQWARRGPAPCF